MDRFEDQFKNTFADYRVPVSDKVWDKVKAKRKLIYWWKRPSFQIAAAILLLVSVVWALMDGDGKFQNSGSVTQEITEVGTQKTEMEGFEITKEDISEKASSDLSSYGTNMASMDPKLTKEEKWTSSVIKQTMPPPSEELDPIKNDKLDGLTYPEMDIVSLEPILTNQVIRGVDILPGSIKPLNISDGGASVKLPTKDVSFGLQKVDLASTKIKLPKDEDKTGPDLLLSQLENLRPGLLDGLRNIASRTTEIEIIW